MIQFKIQFETKSGILIPKNIHSIESIIFNKIIHSLRKTIQIRTKKQIQRQIHTTQTNTKTEKNKGKTNDTYDVIYF